MVAHPEQIEDTYNNLKLNKTTEELEQLIEERWSNILDIFKLCLEVLRFFIRRNSQNKLLLKKYAHTLIFQENGIADEIGELELVSEII